MDVRGPAELARLLVVLERDESLPVAARRARDAAVRDALPDSLTDAERVQRWLEHVDPDGQRLAGEVGDLMRRLGQLMVMTGLLAGWLAVMAAFYYDGSARVNVLAVLGALVGFPLVMLVLSWYSTVVSGTGSGVLASIAGVVARLGAGRLSLWYRKLYTGDGRLGIDALLTCSDASVGTVRRWLFATWSHRAATAFYVAALASALALIVFTDLAFGWSTTLALEPATVHSLTQGMSAPWAWAWPEARPDRELVEVSRFFRLAPEDTPVLEAERLGGWWTFLIGAVALYGLGPRMLSAAVAERAMARAVRACVTNVAGVQPVLQRLREPRVVTTTRPADAATPVERVVRAVAAPLARGRDARAQVVNWSAVPLADDHLAALTGASATHHAGSGMDLAAEAELVARLRDAGTPVVVVCKAWEPPLLDLEDFIVDLGAGDGPAVQIMPIALDGNRVVTPGARDMEVWQRAIGRTEASLAEVQEEPA